MLMTEVSIKKATSNKTLGVEKSFKKFDQQNANDRNEYQKITINKTLVIETSIKHYTRLQKTKTKKIEVSIKKINQQTAKDRI